MPGLRYESNMKALTAAEMREVDRLTTERFAISQSQLMENAGKVVAEALVHQIGVLGPAPVRQIVVLCGKGNNGGDGLVAARHLREEFRHTTVVMLCAPAELKGDPQANYWRWAEIGGETVFAENDAAWSKALARIAAADVLVVALLGTGLRGAASGLAAQAITDLNALSRGARAA